MTNNKKHRNKKQKPSAFEKAVQRAEKIEYLNEKSMNVINVGSDIDKYLSRWKEGMMLERMETAK